MNKDSRKKYSVAYENFILWAGEKYRSNIPKESVMTKYFFICEIDGWSRRSWYFRGRIVRFAEWKWPLATLMHAMNLG